MNYFKLQKKIFYNLIIFFFLISKPTHSLEVKGIAKVVDGDTIIINEKKIRLFGIDAPELDQHCTKPWIQFNFIDLNKNYNCGLVAKEKLKKIISKNEINCKGEKYDRYKRLIAICFKKGKDLNKWLVRNGLAINYTKYSKKYLRDENQAKREKVGLWSGEFDEPWEWRKKNK